MTTIDLSEPEPSRGRWQPVIAWTVAVVLYALVLSLQIGLSFDVTLRQSAVYLYSLALLSIPARRWTRRSLAQGRPTAAVVFSHIGVGTLTVGAWFGVNMLDDRLTIGPDYWLVVYANNWLFQLLSAITTYGTVIGITLAAAGWRRERQRERREAELTIQARDAELGAIRAQFQPHFVLNALNSLLALIDKDPALARNMVVRLADVMREVFARENQPTVPFEREIDLVKAYLDIEQIRFGERLRVTYDIDDGARHVFVPAFLLQPIVENALKHGIAPHVGTGEVRISARVAGQRLTVLVSDSGQGPSAASTGTGIGLQLTRRRLETTYGTLATLSIDHGTAGTVVRIDLPAESSNGA